LIIRVFCFYDLWVFIAINLLFGSKVSAEKRLCIFKKHNSYIELALPASLLPFVIYIKKVIIGEYDP